MALNILLIFIRNNLLDHLLHYNNDHYFHFGIENNICLQLPQGSLAFLRIMSVGAIKEEEGIIYPCANCNSEYKSARQLRRHNDYAHSKGENVCELCDIKLKTKHQISNHKTRCKGGLLKNFKCDECGFSCQAVSKHMGYVKMHQHKRSKHEGLLYTCDECEYKSEYKPNLDQHKRYVHSAKLINCTQCEYLSSTKRAMTRHIQNVHFEKTFQCEQCNFRAGSLPQLNNHKRKSHTCVQENFVQETVEFSEKCFVVSCQNRTSDCEDKSHLKIICNICGNDFESRKGCKLHISQTHMSDNVKKYNCEQCDERFSRLETLKLHKQGKHEEWTHSCIHCDFKTFTQHKLKGHLKIKHNEGDRRLFQCDLCDFKCLDKSELVDHSRSKHKKDPFLCLICDGKYFARRTFRDHMKKHT